MKIFHCQACDHLIFFENSACVRCGATLAYLPELADMGTLRPGCEDVWLTAGPRGEDRPEHRYRRCRNATECACNWAVPSESFEPYCHSCRLTRVIPNLGWPGHREAWTKLEAAKRRLVANLIDLGLPLASKRDLSTGGLAFEFLADPDPRSGEPPVLTGHSDGLIVVNIAEADDAERERRRLQFQEPYRTLLGHFRHEVGHYYWDLLVRDAGRAEDFRAAFGDERRDYGEALQQHHKEGPPPDWPAHFVSSYASAHPWEDWAETWAHYLHITDTLHTAIASGLVLIPERPDRPTLIPDVVVLGRRRSTFPAILDRWFPLTYVLNNLNRGMGLPDAYPFILSAPAVAKLGFVHEVIEAERVGADASPLTPQS